MRRSRHLAIKLAFELGEHRDKAYTVDMLADGAILRSGRSVHDRHSVTSTRGPAMWLPRWLRTGLLIFRVTRFVIEEDDVAGLVWLMIGLGAMWWWYGR